jgi:hypothetical protein
MSWLHSKLEIVAPRPASQQPVLCLVSLLTLTPPSCLLLLAPSTGRVLKLLLITGEKETNLGEADSLGQGPEEAGYH